MTDIDVATGLPVVPEGYYWRVAYEDGNYYKYTNVSLMRKAFRRNGKPKRRDDEVQTCSFEPGPEGRAAKDKGAWVSWKILESAEYILTIQEDRLQRAELIATMKTYEGNYPPKTLNKEEE